MKTATTVLAALLLAAALAPGPAAAASEDVALSQLPAPAQLGALCYPGGRRQLTPEDALWLAKMVDAETWGRPSEADAAAMLWALAQRSAIWSFPKWALPELIQAYSQPINPRWTRSGDKCRSYLEPGSKAAVPGACGEKKLARREQNIRMGWTDVHPVARAAVLAFARGALQNPIPGAVGWFERATWRSRAKNGANRSSDMTLAREIEGNSFFYLTKKPDTRGWDERRVVVAPPGQACPTEVAAAPAKPRPALGSCESDYRYHRGGTIASHTVGDGGEVVTVQIEGAGWRDRVCDDSTGMIHLGGADDAYVSDAGGTKVRLQMIEVTEHASRARVVEGKLTPAMLAGNHRVVLRRKP